MPLQPGTTLGPYQVTAKIGEGGMGEVYQARDTKLDRDVALKVLPEAFTSDPDRLARFEREAKVLASLNHPNIGGSMRYRHLVFPILVLLFLGVAGGVQADEVDDYISAQMENQNIPGLSLVVLRDGDIIKAKGYGVADRRLNTPVTPETVYKIASVSKQFIATGIMLLVQEGRLGLDDPISRYLEETPASWDDITIRHLLTHTSGLVREAPGFDPFKIQSDADVIRTAYPLPLSFVAGDKWEYSNAGYFALAEIIRKVADRPWSDYLTENVFKPSDMNATRTTTTTERVPNRALGYIDNDRLLDADDWPALRPSGAFLSTVLDLAKWDSLLYTDEILSDSTRRQMWTPVTLNDGSSHPYGFGWHLTEVENTDRRVVYHGGGMLGFLAEFVRFVDDRLTVIVLMNTDDANAGGIVFNVALRFYLPAPAAAEGLRTRAEIRWPLLGVEAPARPGARSAHTGSM